MRQHLRWRVMLCGLAAPLALVLTLFLTSAPASAQSRDLEQEKARATEQQREIRQRLDKLQGQLVQTQGQQKQAADALQLSEVAISATIRRLSQLDTLLAKFELELKQTEEKAGKVNARIKVQSEALAEQLRAQYSSGLNAWSALLAGDDPQGISRDLGYLEFVSRARSDAIEALRKDREELSGLQTAQRVQKESIEQTKARLVGERETLAREKTERQKVLARLEQQLASERKQAQKLAQDEQRLGQLVEGLSAQIEQWRQQESRNVQAVREAALAALPQGSGIKRGLDRPVRGQILARFGSKRPDGGAWRGVLIQAGEGDPVRAIGPGMVVFSKWVQGFGNIIILDHGEQFLSVYAYNQSLLKEVGDTVRQADVIASAGNTGGQLESALYFELRHQGNPLDPMLYFKGQ